MNRMRNYLKQKTDLKSESGQASLISMLVAVAIIGLVVGILYFRSGKSKEAQMATDLTPSSQKKTIPGRAMDEGKAVDCRNNISQIRLAINMDADPTEPGGSHPPSLQAVHGLSDSMKVCPISGRPYAYDPQTGQVHCLTPGHQRF